MQDINFFKLDLDTDRVVDQIIIRVPDSFHGEGVTSRYLMIHNILINYDSYTYRWSTDVRGNFSLAVLNSDVEFIPIKWKYDSRSVFIQNKYP